MKSNVIIYVVPATYVYYCLNFALYFKRAVAFSHSRSSGNHFTCYNQNKLSFYA